MSPNWLTSASPDILTAAAVSLLALLLAIWAFRGDRARGRPRCPKCWYSMVGAAGPRCPECGHTAKSPGHLLRPRRRRWTLALALLIAVGGAGYAGVWPRRDALARAILPRMKLSEEIPLAPFTVRIYADRWDGFPEEARVYLNGECRLRLSDYRVSVGGSDEHGRVICGLGDKCFGGDERYLIIDTFSGGAHCCSTYYILRLDPDAGVVPVATLDAAHGDFEFIDLDGDGALECRGQDWTFAYWNTSFASSPAPQITLRFRSGRFVLATDLMRQPEQTVWERHAAGLMAITTGSVPGSPATADFESVTRQVREDLADDVNTWRSGDPPPVYWSILLDLIYTGNEATAWRFADRAWPASVPGREAFLREFRDQLATSPWWPELSALQREAD